jgi:hypothetical protein
VPTCRAGQAERNKQNKQTNEQIKNKPANKQTQQANKQTRHVQRRKCTQPAQWKLEHGGRHDDGNPTRTDRLRQHRVPLPLVARSMAWHGMAWHGMGRVFAQRTHRPLRMLAPIGRNCVAASRDDRFDDIVELPANRPREKRRRSEPRQGPRGGRRGG